MKFGTISSPDIIDTTCEVVYDSGELSSAATNITISNLDGNTDKEYRLIIRLVNGVSGAATVGVQPNGDTGTNYGYQFMYGQNGSTAAGRSTSEDRIYLITCGALNDIGLSECLIYAKTGKVRTALTKQVRSISGTTVDMIMQLGQSWNNTADNITSLNLVGSGANTFGIGSRIILLKKRQLTSGFKTGEIDPQGTTYGHWQLIYDNTLTGAVPTVTISNLDGDKDVMYRLVARIIGDASAGASDFAFRINNDSGANYGYQFMYGAAAVVSAQRGFTTYGWLSNSQLAAGEIHFIDCLMYIKSGYVRTMLCNDSTNTPSSTTVGNVFERGLSWNNTVDNITSIVVGNRKFDATEEKMGIGSHIELWRLNL